MVRYALLICLILPLLVSGQNDSHVYDPDEVEVQPVFEGGTDSLRYFMARNIIYPEVAKIEKVNAVIIMKFVIDAGGEVKNIKSISPIVGFGLEEEAIRVISLTSGKWAPANISGIPVSTSLYLPISFQFATQ